MERCVELAGKDEEDLEAVVLEAPEPTSDATTELFDSVDSFGSDDACAVGVEVGQERGLPAAQGLTQSRDLEDRAGMQRIDEPLRK